MGKITLILGGVKSGKSNYSLEIAKREGPRVAFIATSPYCDEETIERIKKHQLSRPIDWNTFEETRNIAPILININDKFDTVLIDCLTLYVSSFIWDGFDENTFKTSLNEIIEILKSTNYNTIIVSNEVGLSVHPDNHTARLFIDIMGKANQMVSASADEVYFLIAGIPVKLK